MYRDQNKIEYSCNKYCVIGSFNINSLSGKFSEVQEWIQVFDMLDYSVKRLKLTVRFRTLNLRLKAIICTVVTERKEAGGGIVLYIRKTIPSVPPKSQMQRGGGNCRRHLNRPTTYLANMRLQTTISKQQHILRRDV